MSCENFKRSKMKTFIITVVLMTLVTISISLEMRRPIDYRLKYKAANYTSSCTGTGLVCTDCYKIGYCASSGASPIVTDVCPLGEICDSETLTCIKPPSRPTCSPTDHLDFFCVSSGMFPNPGNCKKYHFCVPKGANLEQTVAECEHNYAYNSKTTFCDKLLSNNICNGYPVPLCMVALQSGPVQENPTLYYNCLPHPGDSAVLYPFINACPNGKRYSVENGCT